MSTEDGKTVAAPGEAFSWFAPFRRYQQIKYEHLAAGVAGGVVSSTILHPLDTMRTRLAGNATLITKKTYIKY